ncbi:MAG: efflux RND transporter periplasmic adaptor subunit [Vicingaceae bacterium]|nr:efflux RND transporter periplasmic adaptor subunit [Vicingaceae bacterium]
MIRNLTLIFLTLILLSCSEEAENTISPEIKTITESVYSSVTIQPDSMYEVFSSVTGILDKQLVNEGDEVSIGQELFQITNNNPKLNTQNAKLAMDIARDNYKGDNAVLTDLINEIKLAQLKLSSDSLNYVRQKNLWNQKIGSKLDYDNRKLQYETSKSTVKTLLNKFSRTSSQLKQQYQQAINSYDASLTLTNDFTIESKIKGTVYSIYKKPGEIISAQQAIAMVGHSKDFIAELLIDEVDIIKLKKNQIALITIDAYGKKVFKANINKIYPQKNNRSQTFKVEARFVDIPEKLYPGLSGEANILISEKPNVLTIPKAYLIDETHVKTDNGIIEITTGLESLDLIEILSGITKDDILYFPEE